MANYAVVDGGVVSNVIVSDQAFADSISASHGAVVLCAGAEGIGDSYANGIFLRQQSNISLAASASLRIDAGANGAGSLTYQWKKDGSNISGATSAAFVVNSVVAGDSGSYTCVVSNGTDSRETAAVVVTVS